MAKLHINRWRTKCTFAFSPPACAFPSLTAPLHAPLPCYTARHAPPQRRARTPAPLSLTPVRPQNASPKHRISRTCLVISNEHCTFAHGNQRQDHKERCRSGRTGRTRNAVNGQLFRGFESLSLRNKGCKSAIYAICTLYYTQKVFRYFLYGLLQHDVRDSILTHHSELLELDSYQLLHYCPWS